MRGPLLSGAVGSPVTLRRLAEVVRPLAPVVVVRSLWLASALGSEMPVLGVIGTADLSAARRKRKRAGKGLYVVTGGSLPLAAGAAGAVVVPELAVLQSAALIGFLLEMAPLVRPGGVLVGLDRTKDPTTEAKLAGALLAAGYLGIVQARPREGALLTQGHPPPAPVQRVLAGAMSISLTPAPSDPPAVSASEAVPAP